MITVVSLGGDDEGRDKQAVDVVVRRAYRGAVLVPTHDVGQRHEEAHGVEFGVRVDAHEIAVDRRQQ